MKPEKPTEESTDAADLRRRAQARLQSQTPPPKVPVPTDELQRLVQELQVHQIELEMQNEELGKSQARLETSAARYTDLYDFAPVGYFTLGSAGEITQTNLAGVRLLGDNRAALLGRRFVGFISEAYRPAFNLHLQQVFAGQLQQTCGVGMGSNGEPGRFAHLETTLGPDGQECRIVAMDITQQRRDHEALRVEAIRRRELFDHSMDGIVIIDPQTARFVEFNTAAHRQLGYSREEFAGLSIRDLEARETPEEIKARIENMIQKGWLDFETLQRTREGDIRNVHVRAQVVSVEGQQLYQCNWRDITEHRRAEEALERYARANELLHNSIVALNDCPDLDSALACLAQKAIDLGGMDFSAVYLIDGQDAVLQHQIGLSSELTKQVARRPLNTPYLKAALENPKEILNLITQFPEQAHEAIAHGLRHIYCIGLCSEQQPIGFLTVASRSSEPPIAGNLELIRILALETQSLFHRLWVEERLRSIQTALSEGIVFQTADGVIIDCNPSAERLLGLSRDQILGRTSVNPYWQTVHEDGRVCPGEEHPAMVSLRTRQSCRDVIIGMRMLDGSQRWLNVNTEPMFKRSEIRPYAVMTSFSDITKRREMEQALHISLVEKTVLLQEVHHRVKNNLQLIISLLNLQIGRTQKGDMLDILASTRNRVRSMALIHENLYQPENLAHLNLANYLKHLCASLLRSGGPVSAKVRIESQVENKSILIGPNQAVPFGLLINELVTNALKYAFPEDRTGLIRVTIQSPSREKVLITVADDGVGLPAGLDPHHADGLGLKLVRLLAEQLHGTVNFDRGQGTAVQILFNTPAEAETTHE